MARFLLLRRAMRSEPRRPEATRRRRLVVHQAFDEIVASYGDALPDSGARAAELELQVGLLLSLALGSGVLVGDCRDDWPRAS